MGFNPKFKNLSDKLYLVNLFTEHLDVNVFVVNKHGDVVYANSAAAKTYDCSLEELFTYNVYTMEEHGYIDRTPAAMEVIESKKAVKRYIKTGKNLGMIISCQPIFDIEGNVEYAVAVSHAEDDFLSLINEMDSQKKKLEGAISYINKLSQEPFYCDSENTTMHAVYDVAKKAALSDSVVMIYGPSGSGKEVLAKHIHSISERKNTMFIPINCAAVPIELIESEFFGYEKGSFTGASHTGKLGLFEVATDSTLFLDEIGELTLPMQSKLLRVLESGEFRPIGSNKIHKTNARIIAATNKNLWDLVQSGQFRVDLFYRLNIIPLTLPPLRDRKEDIIPLAHSFLNKLNQQMGTKKYFSEDVFNFFQAYSWPGNIRELKNIVERLVVLSESNKISLSKEYHAIFKEIGNSDMQSRDLTSESNFTREKDTSFSPTCTEKANENLFVCGLNKPYKQAMREFESQYVKNVMDSCGWNISKAAKKLKMHRSSLYNILNRAE